MEISYEEGKLNFILDLFFPLEKMMTGGLVVLHKLAYKLAEKGHNVFIFCEPEYPHPNIKTIRSEVKTEENSFIINYSWESFNFPVKNTVAIYPQITYHNPFNTKHVTRWILYDTQKEIEEKLTKYENELNSLHSELTRLRSDYHHEPTN